YLAMFDADRDPSWLDMTRLDVQALESRLREADNGFAYRAYRCIDRIAKGCETGQVQQVVDHTRDTAAQAWVQHLESALAERLLTGDGARDPFRFRSWRRWSRRPGRGG